MIYHLICVSCSLTATCALALPSPHSLTFQSECDVVLMLFASEFIFAELVWSCQGRGKVYDEVPAGQPRGLCSSDSGSRKAAKSVRVPSFLLSSRVKRQSLGPIRFVTW